jgi:uncharacterized BrkB/YihY/UPF0761 family membrane protein
VVDQPAPSPARQVLPQPLRLVWHTLKAFRANQGPLLAGAVAYDALLATMPFFGSLAFPVLENALSIVFVHRVKTRQRPLDLRAKR